VREARRCRTHPDSIKHPKGIAGRDAKSGPISNRDLGRRRLSQRSQIVQPVALMIFVQSRELQQDFADSAKKPLTQGKARLKEPRTSGC
jgi:hypothetical protein